MTSACPHCDQGGGALAGGGAFRRTVRDRKLAAKLESRMDKYEKRLLEMETKLTKLGKKKSL